MRTLNYKNSCIDMIIYFINEKLLILSNEPDIKDSISCYIFSMHLFIVPEQEKKKKTKKSGKTLKRTGKVREF
jgi:hypothetical protein